MRFGNCLLTYIYSCFDLLLLDSTAAKRMGPKNPGYIGTSSCMSSVVFWDKLYRIPRSFIQQNQRGLSLFECLSTKGKSIILFFSCHVEKTFIEKSSRPEQNTMAEYWETIECNFKNKLLIYLTKIVNDFFLQCLRLYDVFF